MHLNSSGFMINVTKPGSTSRCLCLSVLHPKTVLALVQCQHEEQNECQTRTRLGCFSFGLGWFPTETAAL